ncbi:MAG TPA: carbohydrate kinase family protein [Candidatus Moranbacteria bacterium]|nr:carbohydrate kinase family protein [Candidatus Moranbacteria bacterium]
MRQIISIGSICKDIFFPTSEGKIEETPEDIMAQKKITFELGAKYKIEERYEALGGCAANVAAGLARLGIEASCYSHIGSDEISSWMKKELEKNGVGAELVSQEPDCRSDMSAIIVDKESGERIIFTNQKANGKLEIIPENIQKTEWIFIGDLHGDWEKDLDVIFAAAQENGIKVAFNPRQSNIHDNVQKIVEMISKTQILFLNKDESIEIVSSLGENLADSQINSEEFLAEKLKSLGAEIVSITDGKRGAWATDGENKIFIPGMEVGAVDSTGAGDSFSSGFLAAHIKGKSLEEATKWGISNSSSVVQFYGAIEGLLDENKI